MTGRQSPDSECSTARDQRLWADQRRETSQRHATLHSFAEDLKLLPVGPRNEQAYFTCVRQLSEHFDCSPDQLSPEQPHQYFLHLKTVKAVARQTATQAWRHVDLEPFELLRRFLQHVLPRGFHRVRRFGWWHPGGRVKLNRVRALLQQAPVLTEAERAAWQPPEGELPEPENLPPATHHPQPFQCARCGGVLVLVERWRPGQRPAWRGQDRAPP